MTPESRAWRGDLVVWILVAAAVTASFWFSSGWATGLGVGAWMSTMVAGIHLGRRRNDALRTISGVGDERTRSLYTRSTAVAGTVVSTVIAAWWFVTVIRGEPDSTLFTLWLVFSFSFFLAAVYLSWKE